MSETAEELLRNADVAMYLAKEKGRTAISCSSLRCTTPR